MRPSPNETKKEDCKICRQIRHFLILAAVLLVLIWSQPDWRLPPGFDYATLVGDVFLWAFLAMVAYKAWRYFTGRDR